MAGYNFTKPGIERTIKAVRRVENNPGTGTYADDVREVHRRRLQVTLDTELAGTTDYNVPTKARATVRVGLDADDTLGKLTDTIEVWNRSTTTFPAGTDTTELIHVVEVEEDDKWYVVSSGGSSSSGAALIGFGVDAVAGTTFTANWTWHTEAADPPGLNGDGSVTIDASCFATGVTEAQLLASNGVAVYAYGNGATTASWITISLCTTVGESDCV